MNQFNRIQRHQLVLHLRMTPYPVWAGETRVIVVIIIVLNATGMINTRHQSRDSQHDPMRRRDTIPRVSIKKRCCGSLSTTTLGVHIYLYVQPQTCELVGDGRTPSPRQIKKTKKQKIVLATPEHGKAALFINIKPIICCCLSTSEVGYNHYQCKPVFRTACQGRTIVPVPL